MLKSIHFNKEDPLLFILLINPEGILRVFCLIHLNYKTAKIIIYDLRGLTYSEIINRTWVYKWVRMDLLKRAKVLLGNPKEQIYIRETL